jgi:hypothetical protein
MSLAPSAEPEAQGDPYADFLPVSQRLSKRIQFQENGRSLIDIVAYIGKEEGIAVYVDASIPTELVLHSEKHTKIPIFPQREVSLRSHHFLRNKQQLRFLGGKRLLHTFRSPPEDFTVSCCRGIITQSPGGTDICDTTDQFRYAYATLIGNGSTVAWVIVLMIICGCSERDGDSIDRMIPNAKIKSQDVRSSPDLSGLSYPPGWERQGMSIKGSHPR